MKAKDFRTILFLPNGMPIDVPGTVERLGTPEPDGRQQCIRCWGFFKTAPGEKRCLCLECDAWLKGRVAELNKNPDAREGNMPEGFGRVKRAVKPVERVDHVANRNIGKLED